MLSGRFIFLSALRFAARRPSGREERPFLCLPSTYSSARAGRALTRVGGPGCVGDGDESTFFAKSRVKDGGSVTI